jgi:hypothetical protein
VSAQGATAPHVGGPGAALPAPAVGADRCFFRAGHNEAGVHQSVLAGGDNTGGVERKGIDILGVAGRLMLEDHRRFGPLAVHVRADQCRVDAQHFALFELPPPNRPAFVVRHPVLHVTCLADIKEAVKADRFRGSVVDATVDAVDARLGRKAADIGLTPVAIEVEGVIFCAH